MVTAFLLADPSHPASALGKQLRAMTDGRGVDAALECVGSAGTIRQAWTSVRRGGTCVVVGLGPKDQQVTFSPLELFHFSRTLVSRAPREITLTVSEAPTTASMPRPNHGVGAPSLRPGSGRTATGTSSNWMSWPAPPFFNPLGHPIDEHHVVWSLR